MKTARYRSLCHMKNFRAVHFSLWIFCLACTDVKFDLPTHDYDTD